LTRCLTEINPLVCHWVGKSLDDPGGDDPRTVSAGAVAEGLCRIIEVEGPMRAYDRR